MIFAASEFAGVLGEAAPGRGEERPAPPGRPSGPSRSSARCCTGRWPAPFSGPSAGTARAGRRPMVGVSW